MGRGGWERCAPHSLLAGGGANRGVTRGALRERVCSGVERERCVHCGRTGRCVADVVGGWRLLKGGAERESVLRRRERDAG